MKEMRDGMEMAFSAVQPDFSQVNFGEFWAYLDQLVASRRLVIDRPKGSRHPRYPEFVYPLDYGYLEGTTSGDEGGIDLWLGSQDDQSLGAVLVSVDLKKGDAEIKLLLGCSEEDLRLILDLTNDKSMRAMLVRREEDPRHLLLTRRSVRRFLPRLVPRPVLERLLEAATWAPSAHNRQPWRFAVLETLQARARLAERMGADFRRDLLADGIDPQEVEVQAGRSRRRIQEAPVAVVVCLDVSLGDRYPDARRQQAEYLMGVQGVAMAGQNLLLAAHAEGLGGVWVCAPLFAPETVRQALDLPEHWQPQGLLLLGYPAKIPAPRPRRPLAEVARFL